MFHPATACYSGHGSGKLKYGAGRAAYDDTGGEMGRGHFCKIPFFDRESDEHTFVWQSVYGKHFSGRQSGRLQMEHPKAEPGANSTEAMVVVILLEASPEHGP